MPGRTAGGDMIEPSTLMAPPEIPRTGTGLKVLRVIARLNIGGPARHAALLDVGLREAGFDTLLVHGVPEPHEGSLESLFVERALTTRRISQLARPIRPWRDLRAFAQLTRLIFDERPDVVHTHTAKAGALGRLAALTHNLMSPRRDRCVVIHTFHGNVLSGYFGPVASRIVRLIERCLALVTDRIITISESQQEEIARRFKVAAARKVSVIPLGLELESLLTLQEPTGACRSLFGLDRDDLVFGYVGRFTAIKDLPTLVRGFARAANELPRARLILVGDGELREKIETLVVSLGLASRVRFTGWRQDLPSVYAAMDVGVLSSLNEGTPVSLIEAMAAGRAVVATRVGGVPDIVRDGETGMLVRPGDVEALAAAMVRLGRNRPERIRLGSAARRAMAARFNPDNLITDISRLYVAALMEKRGALARQNGNRRQEVHG